MNKPEGKIDDDLFPLFPLFTKKDLLINVKENIKDKNINGCKNIDSDFEETKKMIEQKIDFYIMKDYNELLIYLEEKMNLLLIKQENQFIKNQMIKQKIYYLENYIKNLLIKK